MAWVEVVPSSEPARRRLRLKNPVSLEPVGEFDVQTEAAVRAAEERARKAQPDWAELSYDERARPLHRLVRLLIQRQDEVLESVVRETGKPPLEALSAELVAACDALTFYASRAGRILADRTVPLHWAKGKKLRVAYRPLGVVGVITPWSRPLLLPLGQTAQALMAGNAVILKPSEAAAFTGRLLAELFEEAGLPEGLFQAVLGDDETGAALCEAGLDQICFTGTAATGRRVAERCARRLVPCTLELGGKDPMIVCADADLERAARGAVWGAFTQSGQACASVERLYVVEEVADAFIEKVLERTAELRQGPEGETDVGAMGTPEQLALVESHVEEAISRGARVLAGGRRNPAWPGLFFEPTVLTDVSHEMRVMREETFGPVLPIRRVPDEAEAIRLANDSSFGLSASVWTRDKRRGVRMAKSLHAGAVVVNDCLLTYGIPEAPFGGRGDSGYGQVNGEIGLRSFCHAQSIVVDRFGRRSEPAWYPYSGKKLKSTRRKLRWVWGTPLGRLLS